MPASVMRCFGVTAKILSSRSRHSAVTLGLRGYEYCPAPRSTRRQTRHNVMEAEGTLSACTTWHAMSRRWHLTAFTWPTAPKIPS